MIHLVRKKILNPLKRFFHDSRSIGITLLSCTIISLVISNMNPWKDTYRKLWSIGFDGTLAHSFHAGYFSFPNSLSMLINDGLISLFFFLAGMEIKRELIDGELASFKKAILPLAAALGGMLVPAILFFIFTYHTSYLKGWAIPTATDIAFALGIISLLGKRIPVGLKIFITALAIIDDLGAIIIIALFYGGTIHLLYLLGCMIIIVILLISNQRKMNWGWIQWLCGLILWYCMYHSGIHATVAGVIFAFLVPKSMLRKFELQLHIPVYFIIMPLFALANTAIPLPETGIQNLISPLSIGIIAGLCIGKPIGICSACYLLVSKKIAHLPNGVNWYNLIGASILAGIGFTMSIFISTLAFGSSLNTDSAKISVLFASLIAMVVGYLWLRGRASNNY